VSLVNLRAALLRRRAAWILPPRQRPHHLSRR